MADLLSLLKDGHGVVMVTLADLKEFHKEIIQEARDEAAKEFAESGIDPLLSPEVVSEMLNVDLSTLWRWDKKGYLVCKSIGGKRRYKKSDIKRILEDKSDNN